MSKLYFKYGTMGAAKTAEALMCKYRYEETGQKVLLLKTDRATRDGDYTVKSRIGLSSPAESLSSFLDGDYISKAAMFNVVILDECQFATEEDIDLLARIADEAGVPVICYGLKTDYNKKLFEGSKRLLEIADSISEIKSVCACGKKAIFNIKISGDDINGKYISCCRKCADKTVKEREPIKEDTVNVAEKRRPVTEDDYDINMLPIGFPKDDATLIACNCCGYRTLVPKYTPVCPYCHTDSTEDITWKLSDDETE